jgi:tetratricopeptide (TPR) repeat protein
MSVHLERARLLLQQHRPAEAEHEAGLALAQTPDQPRAHALLALSRLEQDKREPALEAARAAVGLAPDSPYYHYVLALVQHRTAHNKEALASVQEAIRLDPEDADHFSLQAAIQLNLHDWNAALASADQALALDPEHVAASNFRSMALVRLGRKAEAMATVGGTLARDPESAFSHANQGWNCLHHNDPRQAQEHFREALRLDPDLDYARDGMLEALKARNPVYRGMLAYFLWMGRQSGRLRAAVIVAFVLVTMFVGGLADTYPILWVPMLLIYLFVYLTWTADVAFNLLLLLDRFGRHVLRPAQRTGAFCYGGVMLAALGCLAAAFMVKPGSSVFIAFLVLLAVSICVAVTFRRGGRNRWIFGAATVGLAGLGLTGCYLLTTDAERGHAALDLFRNGFFWLQILTFILRE